MAEKKEDVDATPEASGGKSKMMIIIAVVVLALAAGGYFFLMGGEEAASDETAEKKDAAPVKQTPIYFSLEKPLIVNFAAQSGGAVKYLSVDLKVMARDQATIDAFTLHTPAMKHYLLMLFFGQDYETLNTSNGKKALQKITLDTINEVLKTENHDGEIEAVYFTRFLMQ